MVEVWEENLPAFQVFCAIGTQWRVGQAGPIGLDYNVLYHKLDRMRLDPDQYDELEADIMIMERAALETMRER